MLHLTNLTRQFGACTAVNQLNMTVQRGQIYGFLGPNGAGKTTTIRMITGLLRPTSGSVVFQTEDGPVDIIRQPRVAKRLFGYVPDTPYLYNRLTGREFVIFAGALYGVGRAAAEEHLTEWFALLGLADMADELIESYSHGMRQKLVFTASLVHNPPVLVVDEPMVGLDPRSARIMKEVFLRESHERGRALLLSTHSLDVAEQVCDRIGILNRGRLIAEGNLMELRQTAAAHGNGTLEEVFLRLTEEESPPATP